MSARTERTVESRNTDARWVCTVLLSTGSVIEVASERARPDWDQHRQNRSLTIGRARMEAEEAQKRYGVESISIQVREEYRTVERVTVAYYRSELHSVIYPGGEA